MSALLTKLSVDDIQYAIWKSLGGGNTECIPNVSFGFFKDKGIECDLLYITPYNYLHEFEIKRSWSDFVADFKKNNFHSDLRLMRLTFVLPVAVAGEKLKTWCDENWTTFKRSFDFWFYDEYARLYRPNVFVSLDYSSNTYIDEKRRDAINAKDPLVIYRRKIFAEERSELYRLCMVRYWNRRKLPNDNAGCIIQFDDKEGIEK